MEFQTFIKEIVLPAGSDIFVKQGDYLFPETAVAEITVPGAIRTLDASAALNVFPEEIKDLIYKNQGDIVARNEIIGGRKLFGSLMLEVLKTPVDGRIEQISTASGLVLIREEGKYETLFSSIKGVVTDIEKRTRIKVAVTAFASSALFGIGRRSGGKLWIIDNNLQEEIPQGSVVLKKENLEKSDLYFFIKKGVKGVIAPSIDSKDLEDVIGKNIFAGGTISGMSIVLTEGFGSKEMKSSFYNLFAEHAGRAISIEPSRSKSEAGFGAEITVYE